MKAPRLWISTGEISGDMHGAALLRELSGLCPELKAYGMGGEALQAAGQKNLFHIRSLSVMGVTEIFGALPRIARILRQTRKALTQLAIDAVVLVDAPSFNFRVGAIAQSLGIPVYYHIPPKVWASRPERVQILKRIARKLFCIFPFEEAFYRQHGLGPEHAIFVGNPLVDMIAEAQLEQVAVHPGRIGLMPGSRRSEIRSLMPEFAAAARLVAATQPDLEFVCIKAPGADEGELLALWQQGAGPELPCLFTPPESRYAVIKSCVALMQASGTATLEAALIGTPGLIAYRVSKLSEIVMRRFIRVPYIGLPNLILGREVLPECLQEQARGEHLAKRLSAWLTQPHSLEAVRGELARIQSLCGPPGSAGRAAGLLLEDLRLYTAAHHA